MSDFCIRLEEPTSGEEIISVLEDAAKEGLDTDFAVEILDTEVMNMNRIGDAQPTVKKTGSFTPNIPSMQFPKKDGLQFSARRKPRSRLEKALSLLGKNMNAAAFEVDPDKTYSTLAEVGTIGYKSGKPVRNRFNEEYVKDFESFARELNRRLGYSIEKEKKYTSTDLKSDKKYSDLHFKSTTTTGTPTWI